MEKLNDEINDNVKELLGKTKKVKIWKGLTLFELFVIIAFTVVSICDCSTVHSLTTTTLSKSSPDSTFMKSEFVENVKTVKFNKN